MLKINKSKTKNKASKKVNYFAKSYSYLFLFLFLFNLSFSSSLGQQIVDENINIYEGNLTNLSEMEDVSITNPQNDDVLSWSSTLEKWVSKSMEEIISFITGVDSDNNEDILLIINSSGALGYNNSVFNTKVQQIGDNLYYYSTNPYNFYNSTDFNIDDYTNTSEILNFDYFNNTNFPYTHLTNFTDDLGNGNWTSDKTDYYTKTETNTEISTANTSVVNWADSKFADLSGGNNFSGQQDFNGGWTNNGFSIIDGDIYANTGYFYNISSLDVNSLEINGSLLPYKGLSNQFDIGNSTLNWRDLYLGGEVSSNGTGDNYFLGNVGIGTTSPGAKLEVNGSVKADSFIGDGSGLDGILGFGDVVNTNPFNSWDISSATYDSISISTQDANPRDLFFKPDGTKMYEIGYDGDKVYQYSLSTPWDLSSATYDSISISTQDAYPQGLFFKPDGTKMYEIGWGGDKIYQYSLSTPWDLSTATYDSISISTQDAYPQGLFFKPDGTKMYEIGWDGDKIYQYSLSTPWDLSTATYDSISISTQDTYSTGLFFKPDGTKMYEIGADGDKIYQYSLSTPWDLSTATYDSIFISTQDTLPTGLFFEPDGTKMYEIGSNGDKIYQYSLSAWTDANVGIGTTAPITPLHIKGYNPDVDALGMPLFFEAERARFGYGTSPTADAKVAFGSGWGTAEDFAVHAKSGGDFSEATQRFTVKMNGNVGIGTTEPGAKLEVNGSMKVGGELNISLNNITNIDRACFDESCAIYLRYNGTCIVSSNNAEGGCI